MKTEKFAQLDKSFDQIIKDCNATPEFGIREVIVPTVVLEKFIELIVRECISVVTDTTNDREWDSYNQATASAIKEHFEIK